MQPINPVGRTDSKLLLTWQEAASRLGMSLRSFERYVQPNLAMIRRERMRLGPVKELERWIERKAD